MAVLALLGWQLGHGTALQPWPSTLSINISVAESSLYVAFTPSICFTSHILKVNFQICLSVVELLQDTA